MRDSLPRFQCDITAASQITVSPAFRMIAIEDGSLIVRLFAPNASPDSVAAVGRVLKALVEEIKSNGD
jgi:hypothetical protein